MAKKFVKILLGFFFILSGCCKPLEEGKPYFKYVDQITREFVHEMKKEYGLMCYVSGGSTPNSVNSIDISFNLNRRVTIQEARELIVKAITRLVDKVNAHEKIRPYLTKYPFPLEGADVSIVFQKKDGSPYLDGSVVFVYLAKDGNIAYDTIEIRTRPRPWQDVNSNLLLPAKDIEDKVFVPLLKESYEEAKELAKLKQFVK